VYKTGKYLFAIPFGIFGVMHFTSAEGLAQIAPFGGVFIVYLTGLALIAATVSIIIGKMDKLATVLLASFLLLTALLVHAAGVSSAADPGAAAASMSGLLKDISLAGAALLYAGSLAKDNAVIG
jgi:apolipoprotein N-acyltransferase